MHATDAPRDKHPDAGQRRQHHGGGHGGGAVQPPGQCQGQVASGYLVHLGATAGNALKLVTGETWRAQGVGVGEGRFMGESERMPVPGELRARANTSLQHCTLSG